MFDEYSYNFPFYLMLLTYTYVESSALHDDETQPESDVDIKRSTKILHYWVSMERCSEHDPNTKRVIHRIAEEEV